MPRESFVWVSAFPAPWHGRFGGGGLCLGGTMCPGQLAGGPVSADCQSSVRPPPTPQTGTNVQRVPTPVLTPATMHLVASPAPVRQALPWPGTTGTAEVSGPGGRSSPWSWAGCVRGILEPGTRPGHTSGHGLFWRHQMPGKGWQHPVSIENFLLRGQQIGETQVLGLLGSPGDIHVATPCP